MAIALLNPLICRGGKMTPSPALHEAREAPPATLPRLLESSPHPRKASPGCHPQKCCCAAYHCKCKSQERGPSCSLKIISSGSVSWEGALQDGRAAPRGFVLVPPSTGPASSSRSCSGWWAPTPPQIDSPLCPLFPYLSLHAPRPHSPLSLQLPV